MFKHWSLSINLESNTGGFMIEIIPHKIKLSDPKVKIHSLYGQ